MLRCVGSSDRGLAPWRPPAPTAGAGTRCVTGRSARPCERPPLGRASVLEGWRRGERGRLLHDEHFGERRECRLAAGLAVTPFAAASGPSPQGCS